MAAHAGARVVGANRGALRRATAVRIVHRVVHRPGGRSGAVAHRVLHRGDAGLVHLGAGGGACQCHGGSCGGG